MKKYKYLLFDLDGTLTDSCQGILNCAKHALITGGYAVPEESELMAFIGPPLLESFQGICGLSYKEAAAAVVRYRERYAETGLFENRVYEGIPELLCDLRNAGFTLGIATSKPEVFTLRILEKFGILDVFHAVAGCSIDKEGETKADMIRLAMKRLGLTDKNKPDILMIGDRKHDILGARECGIDCAGVYYGFAPKGELEEYGADYVFESVNELRAIIKT